jgi:hypothetical protein
VLRRLLRIAVAVVLVALCAFALALRGESDRAVFWRAHLRSLAADRDADVRNNLLRDGGDPFALHRLLLAAPAAGADRATWNAFAAAAAAPRTDYTTIDATLETLESLAAPRGARDAYRYLALWSFWQRNRSGSAAVMLAGLRASALPAANAAAALAAAAGADGEVQLAVPGPLRSAGAGGRLRYRLRRILPLNTRRVAVAIDVVLGAPLAARTTAMTFSAGSDEFVSLALLPAGESELTTPRAVIRGPAPWQEAGRHRILLVWDSVAEEATLSMAGGESYRVQAPGAIAPLEPPAEIELRFEAPGSAELVDLVVATAPRG